VKRVLITGMSGTGESSLLHELAARDLGRTAGHPHHQPLREGSHRAGRDAPVPADGGTAAQGLSHAGSGHHGAGRPSRRHRPRPRTRNKTN
jgi:hypothetical protein